MNWCSDALMRKWINESHKMNKLKISSTHTITTNVGNIFNVSNVGMCQDLAAPF